VLGLSLGGLLVAIAMTGIAGLVINENVNDITQRALEHDVDLEDEGDDLRAAVLDLRHYHRDLFFVGPTRPGSLSNLSGAYFKLQEEIDEYAALDISGAEDIVTPAELQALSDSYYETFMPAIDLYYGDRQAFDMASEQGLAYVQEMELAAQEIDGLGEQRAEASLANVDQANEKARVILLSVLGGLVLVGAGLAWTAIRVVAQIRHLYEGQQAASTQLSKALQAKSDFIADASHELRTPLTVLRGNAEAGLAIDRECVHREILEEIVSESTRMTRLVEDLLFLARSDASSVPLNIETVAAEPLLLEVSERAKVLVQREASTLVTGLAGHGTLNVDVARIEQAIMILIDNAAKYSPPGSRISLNSSSWKEEFTIEVADEGPGMRTEDIPHIFDRFHRIDKVRNRRLGGAGLGLAIAKTIVDAHHGRIDVQSQLGHGTKMRIQLPLATPAVRRSTAEAPKGLKLVS
jgi:signal transduction histidine kinase